MQMVHNIYSTFPFVKVSNASGTKASKYNSPKIWVPFNITKMVCPKMTSSPTGLSIVGFPTAFLLSQELPSPECTAEEPLLGQNH